VISAAIARLISNDPLEALAAGISRLARAERCPRSVGGGAGIQANVRDLDGRPRASIETFRSGDPLARRAYG
jgi:hypothetical protein